ncbi:MAG: bifunctional riboflavin kinase/FAD synthetase [Aquisalimonadaceae bacterium]
MELIRGIHNLRAKHRGCVATIGNFDGVHRGHQAMLQRLGGEARALGVPITAISFEPDPREYFAPVHAPARLTSLRDKVRRLEACGVDYFLCLPFGAALASMDPEVFIHRILVDGLAIRHLAVGDDFRFGHRRVGDYAALEAAGPRYGFSVSRTDTVREGGERVSSTRIRDALERADLAGAERLLGGPYSISGRVIRGERIGRKLGFPTANIGFRQRPALDGIFVVEVRIEGGALLPAVASVGTRPTVNGIDPVLEVHLLDFAASLYGKHLEVIFRRFLRGQVRYEGLEPLREQIARDVSDAHAWFKAREWA